MQPSLGVLLYALRSLRVRAVRHGTAGLALFLLAAMLSSVLFLSDALRASYVHASADLPALLLTPLHAGRPTTLPCAQREQALALEGVASARMRVWGYVPLEGAAANLVVGGIDSVRENARISTVTSARNLAPTGGWMLLGEALATTLGVRSGDVLTFPLGADHFLELRIAGILPAQTLATAGDAALMTERDARSLLGMRPEECTDLLIAVHDPAEAPVVARKLLRAFPQARILERSALTRAFELTLGTRGGLLFFALVPALFGVLVLAWERARLLGSEEQREAAVLRCVGWSARDVLLARSWEQLFAALVPVLLGALAAYGFVFVLGAPGLLRALAGWSLLPAFFPLVPATETASLVAVLSLCVGPVWLASLLPSWRASLGDPYEALG